MICKRGRPKKEVSKSESFTLRLTKEEQNKLEYISFETGKSRSEVLLKGLEMQYKLHKLAD